MTPPRVALGVLSGVTGGPATYGRRLGAALARRADLALVVLTDRPDAFADTGAEIVEVPMRGGVDRLRWQHVALPRALRRLGCELYHDTKNALPLGLRIPAVVTVHDLAYVRTPETFAPLSRWFLTTATRHAVRRARAVVVPSRATAADVADVFPGAGDRVRVVLHGIDPMARPSPDECRAVRARYGLPERYVLHVGTVQARKNVDLLVRAVRTLRSRHPDLRCVLVGRQGWRAERALAEFAADDTALWLGEVERAELPVLYREAEAFVSPSAYEGFGLAVADALAAGTPCIVADRAALPEVCGTAGILLSELGVESIASAIDAVLTDAELRARLAAAGPERAAAFTWERSAAETVAVYREALSRGGGGESAP